MAGERQGDGRWAQTRGEARSGSSERRNLDTERLLGLYETMLRIRAFEEAGLAAQKEGLVLGAIHPSIGQEAVAAGICGNLRPDDVLLSTHRGHGHTLAKGADPTAMMCELFGARGRHLRRQGRLDAHRRLRRRHARRQRRGRRQHRDRRRRRACDPAQRGDRIVCCIFGDGAINRGPFLEGLNWARIFDLPVLFVCEDNGFAATTRTAALTGGPGPAARALSLGIPAAEVDGNDVLAVDETARELTGRIRDGGGPQFLWAKTYRLAGHTAADAGAYRSAAEVAERWRDDPIAACRALLQGAGIDEAALDERGRAAEAEIARAFAAAKAAAWPDPMLALTDVQDIGMPVRSTHG